VRGSRAAGQGACVMRGGALCGGAKRGGALCSGAKRGGARAVGWRRVGLLATLVVGGCAGPLALDGSSASLGSHADGVLRSAAALPVDGDGYTVLARWRPRRSNYGTDELVGVLARAARQVAAVLPGGVAAIGDLSRQSGGPSLEHKSHQDGRDVDIFFYAVDSGGRPVRPREAMLRFGPDGHAVRWSPARGLAPPSQPVPSDRFDAARNWALVRALLTDGAAEVQWIFVQHALGALMLRAAAEAGDDPALVARAAIIIHEPTDAEAHDDHMHVRLYCDPADRGLTCQDRGPVRWWKKAWKYMAPPFGRPGGQPGVEALRQLARLGAGELPALWLAGTPTT
jgi:penicillin-insensitive murein endopeptidase